MSLRTKIDILSGTYDVEFSYHIDQPENRGEHIEMIYLVCDVRLFSYGDEVPLPCPPWLRELVEEALNTDRDAYTLIREEEH